MDELDRIQQKFNEVDKELEEERKKLDEIAEACLRANQRLSDCPALLRQNDTVERLVLEEHKLLKMLEDFE